MNSQQKVATMRKSYYYAQAYLNITGHTLTKTDIEAIRTALNLFEQNPVLKQYLALDILHTARASFLTALQETYALPPSFIRCVKVLDEHSLLTLLPDVMDWVITLYYKHHGYTPVHIETASPITKSEEKALAALAQQKIRQPIIEKYSINPALIAGVRIYSEGLLWEDSLATRLKMIEKLCV